MTIVRLLLLALPLAMADTCVSSENCLNGGVCRIPDSDEHAGRHCHCPVGFGGTRCEHYCPLECQNSGHCHYALDEELSSLSDYLDKDPSHFECKCLGHFSGQLCDVPYENCADGQRCMNHGVCTYDDRGQSTCACTAGFYGDSCELTQPALGNEAPIVRQRSALVPLSLLTAAAFFIATAWLYRRRERPPQYIQVDLVPNIAAGGPKYRNIV